MTAVFGSGIRSMSDSWISWNPRIDEPSNPRPSSNTSSVSSCAGIEKCCINPGRSQNRTSMTSMPLSLTSFRTSPGVRSSTGATPSARRSTRTDAAQFRTASARQLVRSSRCAYELAAAHRVGDETRDDVRVHVGVRAPVLDVALLVDLDLPRDAHRRAAVGDAVAELVPRRGLVQTGEPVLDLGAVVLDVLDRLLRRALRTP